MATPQQLILELLRSDPETYHTKNLAVSHILVSTDHGYKWDEITGEVVRIIPTPAPWNARDKMKNTRLMNLPAKIQEALDRQVVEEAAKIKGFVKQIKESQIGLEGNEPLFVSSNSLISTVPDNADAEWLRLISTFLGARKVVTPEGN